MRRVQRSRILMSLGAFFLLGAAAPGLVLSAPSATPGTSSPAGVVATSPHALPAPDSLAALPLDALVSTPGAASVALNDDATGLFLNPAAMDRSIPVGWYMSWEKSELAGSPPSAAALGLTLGPLGFGYVRERPQRQDRVDRIILAQGGATMSALSVGFRETWERHKLPGPDAKIWRFDAGLLCRPARWLSFGALATDLNQDVLLVPATAATSTRRAVVPRAYTLGLGLRPLPGPITDRLTLFADISGEERQVWKDEAVLRTGVTAEVLPGIDLSGSLGGRLGDFSGTREYRIGLGVHFTHASLLGGTTFASRPKPGSTGEERKLARSIYALQATPARQRTLVREPVAARMDVSGAYGDASQSGLSIPIPFLGNPSMKSVRPVLRQLRRAEEDPDVRGVLLVLGPTGMGALSSEVRDGIARVRAQGKPVVAWMEECDGIGQYYLASACNRVVIDSVSALSRLGFRADLLYLGAFLDSAGIEFEKVAHGRYKTAGEELILSHASEGMKESVNSVIDDMREVILTDISNDRNLSRETLIDLFSGRIIESPEALRAGLVDSLGDRRAAERILFRLMENKEQGKPKGRPLVSVKNWQDREYTWTEGPKVAVLWVDGTIVSGSSNRGFLSGNTMGSETVVSQLRALKDQHDVKVVVLRIDSGGGSGLASDEIWRAVHEVQKSGKKVVASMSRVAGSGGYYIACGADAIYADPMTITGSIGVLDIKLNLADFYSKHRIGVETFQRGSLMGMYSTAVPLSPEEREDLRKVIDDFYGHFLTRVAAGRPLTREQVDSVGQGRIWTGRQALDRKLIDHLGGLHEAVAGARELAGLPPDAKVKNVYPPAASFFERMLAGGEQARRETMTPGLLALSSQLSPIDLWLLGRQLAARDGLGRLNGWRAENPLLESLAGSW